MLIISKEETRALMPVGDAIEIVGNAYAELTGGTADVPDRIGVSSRKELGTTLVMPGFLEKSDSVAVKLVSVFPNNAQYDLPAIHALVVLFDAETGAPLAAIEGGYLTALRTGASCGLATRLLSRTDSKTLAIIGAGAQSRLILPSVCSVRNIERAFIYDQNSENALAFVNEMGTSMSSGPELVQAASSGEAIKTADVVCTATTSYTPVFDGNELAIGTHINGIGSFKPDMREVGNETIVRCDKIVVDSKDGALIEAGEILHAIKQGVIKHEDIYGEIGEIVNGSRNGRENDSEITFFKSVGNAALDVAVAAEVYQRAVSSGAGVDIDLLGTLGSVR